MAFEEEINRLGFDAWADNKMVNAIEDFVMPGEGWIRHEGKMHDLFIKWDNSSIHCTIRAHTANGWQTYERNIKR